MKKSCPHLDLLHSGESKNSDSHRRHCSDSCKECHCKMSTTTSLKFNSSPTKKLKMPEFLRLDSVGESSSPTEFYDTEPLSIIKSGSQYPGSFSPYSSQTTPSKPTQSARYTRWSPSKMASATAQMFSPNKHSTPTSNFMKSHSFPDAMHPPTMSSGSAYYSGGFNERMNGCSSKQLFFNASLPSPPTEEKMEARTLCASLSAPSLSLCWAHGHVRDLKCYSDSTAGLPESPKPKDQALNYTNMKTEGAVGTQSPSTSFASSFQPPKSSTPGVHSVNCSEISPNSMTPKGSVCQQENTGDSYVKEKQSASSESPDKNNICEEKQNSDRSFVLFRERKCTKKGRPSAKKQKKRQREKQKQSSDSLNTSESSLIFSLTVNDVSDNADTQKKRLHVSVSNDSISFMNDGSQQCTESDFDITFSSANELTGASPSSVPGSSPTTSNQSSLACFVISRADSDEEDSETGSEDDDDSFGDDSWSSDDMEAASASLCGSQLGFGIALSLDSIFKKKEVPSLQSVMQEGDREGVGSPNSFKVYVGSPVASSQEDSFQFSDSLPSSPLAQSMLNGFSQGLCLDSILGHVVTVTPLGGKSAPAAAADNQSQDADPLTPELQKINAEWNKNYQTSGFRSCSTTSQIISHPTIKVSFAGDSQLATVHEVGNEDRKGIWQNYALDRERFRRRIEEVDSVVGPILDSEHRKSVQARIYSLSQQAGATEPSL